MDEISCNQHINQIFDNIVDYVQAHYLTKREDTPFWKEVRYNLKLTPNLENYLQKWRNRLPIIPDISCSWGMFGAANYIPILYGLNWFDTEKIKSEYFDFYAFSIEQKVLSDLNKQRSPMFPMSHKQFIKQIISVPVEQLSTGDATDA
jgi:tryptophan halogenase